MRTWPVRTCPMRTQPLKTWPHEDVAHEDTAHEDTAHEDVANQPSLPPLSSASATPRTFRHFWAPPSQVPQLLDMAVSPVVPVASLTSSGHVIVFPK